MRKNVTIIMAACIAIFLVASPVVVAALDLGGNMAQNAAIQAGYDPATKDTSLAENAGFVIKAALSFVGVIFLILMVYAGYLWMTARGEEDQVEKSQKIIRAAIIGLIITTGAYSVTALIVPQILSRTGGQSTQSADAIGCCMVCDSPQAASCDLIPAQNQGSCEVKCLRPSDCVFTLLPVDQCQGRRSNQGSGS